MDSAVQPATRRDRKKLRTRSQIFDAALALFRERGFDRVPIGEICTRADVARGTFFLHFPSKAELLRELDRRLARELSERLAAGPEAGRRSSAVSEYRMLVDHIGERWRADADVLGAMLRERLAAPDAARADDGTDLCGAIEAVVRRGQQRGEFRRAVPPRLAAMLFLGTAAAVLSGAAVEDVDATPEEIRNQLLHLLLHGLLEPKPRLKWKAPEEERGR